MSKLSHIDDKGQARMVDVSEKAITARRAVAEGFISMRPETLVLVESGQSKKGDVIGAARIAGIMAAKRTHELIPLCHPLGLDNCRITITINPQNELEIDCTASITAKTGIEMEALMGASVAALTVYDMCKALSHDIVIKETRLLEKSGGKNDFKRT